MRRGIAATKNPTAAREGRHDLHESETHMFEDRFDEALNALHIPHGEERQLIMLPVLWVAWADGPPQAATMRRSQLLADRLLLPEEHDPSDRWMRRGPERDEVEAGCTILGRLALAPDDHTFQTESLLQVLQLVDWVARSGSGQRCDSPWSPSPRQRRARYDVENWLGLSIGDSWADVINELEDFEAAPVLRAAE